MMTLEVQNDLGGPMLRAYRLQILAPPEGALQVVEEREVRAPSAGSAIEALALETWPPQATLVRLLDLDGAVLAERARE
jgi:hypothetical protein